MKLKIKYLLRTISIVAPLISFYAISCGSSVNVPSVKKPIDKDKIDPIHFTKLLPSVIETNITDVLPITKQTLPIVIKSIIPISTLTSSTKIPITIDKIPITKINKPLVSTTRSKEFIDELHRIISESNPSEGYQFSLAFDSTNFNNISEWGKSKNKIKKIIDRVLEINPGAIAISSNKRKIGIDLEIFTKVIKELNYASYQLGTFLKPITKPLGVFQIKSNWKTGWVRGYMLSSSLDEEYIRRTYLKKTTKEVSSDIFKLLSSDKDDQGLGSLIVESRGILSDYLNDYFITKLSNMYYNDDWDRKRWEPITKYNKAMVEIDLDYPLANEERHFISRIFVKWDHNIFNIGKSGYYPIEHRTYYKFYDI